MCFIHLYTSKIGVQKKTKKIRDENAGKVENSLDVFKTEKVSILLENDGLFRMDKQDGKGPQRIRSHHPIRC